MRIAVHFFGHFRDVFPDVVGVEVPSGATVEDLSRAVVMMDPRLEAIPKLCRAAVNEEYADSSHVLRQDDTVAFIPPLSGG